MRAAAKGGEAAGPTAASCSRSPERQTLADAIDRRARARATVERRKTIVGDVWRKSSALYSERDGIEETLSKLDAMRRAYLAAEEAGEPAGRPPAKSQLEARIAEIDAARAALRVEATDLEKDVQAAENSVQHADYDINRAIDAIVVADPTVAEILLARREAYYRYKCLNEAAASLARPAVGGGWIVDVPSRPETPAIPVCPWDEALKAMRNDPDVPLPILADVLAGLPPVT